MEATVDQLTQSFVLALQQAGLGHTTQPPQPPAKLLSAQELWMYLDTVDIEWVMKTCKVSRKTVDNEMHAHTETPNLKVRKALMKRWRDNYDLCTTNKSHKI